MSFSTFYEWFEVVHYNLRSPLPRLTVWKCNPKQRNLTPFWVSWAWVHTEGGPELKDCCGASNAYLCDDPFGDFENRRARSLFIFTPPKFLCYQPMYNLPTWISTGIFCILNPPRLIKFALEEQKIVNSVIGAEDKHGMIKPVLCSYYIVVSY